MRSLSKCRSTASPGSAGVLIGEQVLQGVFSLAVERLIQADRLASHDAEPLDFLCRDATTAAISSAHGSRPYRAV